VVYTYLYKQDVNIKRRMLNSYDVISTEDVSTNTITLPTTPKMTQTVSFINLDIENNINEETIN
jgi:dTDP-4-amino-4,6-dideoxygalactose transaminase